MGPEGGRRWTVHQKQNEGIHEVVEVVEKLRRRELGRQQEFPGRVGGVPNTNSAEETPDCSRGTLLRPRRTQGSSEGQEEEERRATKAAFSSQPPLHHAVGLGVVDGRPHLLNSHGPTEGRPRRRSELGALVRSHSGRDPETGDPLHEGVDASMCGGLLDGVGGWPMC